MTKGKPNLIPKDYLEDINKIAIESGKSQDEIILTAIKEYIDFYKEQDERAEKGLLDYKNKNFISDQEVEDLLSGKFLDS